MAKQAKTSFLHGPTLWKSPIVGIEPKGSPQQTVAAKTCTYNFFENHQDLPHTLLLEMTKKKMGVTVLILALRTKPSPTIIETIAKTQTIWFSTRPLHPVHRPYAVRWTLNFGPARSQVTSGSAADHCPATSQLGWATLRSHSECECFHHHAKSFTFGCIVICNTRSLQWEKVRLKKHEKEIPQETNYILLQQPLVKLMSWIHKLSGRVNCMKEIWWAKEERAIDH